jgi:hypothetical protein
LWKCISHFLLSRFSFVIKKNLHNLIFGDNPVIFVFLMSCWTVLTNKIIILYSVVKINRETM